MLIASYNCFHLRPFPFIVIKHTRQWFMYKRKRFKKCQSNTAVLVCTARKTFFPSDRSPRLIWISEHTKANLRLHHLCRKHLRNSKSQKDQKGTKTFSVNEIRIRTYCCRPQTANHSDTADSFQNRAKRRAVDLRKSAVN